MSLPHIYATKTSPVNANTLDENFAQLNMTLARTAAEIAAGVTPTAYHYQPGDVRRYGALLNGAGGHDDTSAWLDAIAVAEQSSDFAVYNSDSPANGTCVVYAPSGYSKVTAELVITSPVAIRGEAPSEYSSGTRIIQMTNNADLFRVAPQAQGMSVSFENLTLRNLRTGSGVLIRVQRTTANCNSQRYINLTFGPIGTGVPLSIEAGDDVLIDNPLFDVSGSSAIALGTSAAANRVTNCVIRTPNFFQIPANAILLYNVKNLTIDNARVYPADSASRMAQFINASDTTPYLVENVNINGGVFENVNCIYWGLVNHLSINGTVCKGSGLGAGATRSFIELTGACSGVVVSGNAVSGTFDTKNFYNDISATVASGVIAGNVFTNTGGGGDCIKSASANLIVFPNKFVDFVRDITVPDYLAAGLPLKRAITITYAATIDTDASLGDYYLISASNGTAFTVNNPSNPSVGQQISYRIRNISGVALGVLTWGAQFKLGAAWTQPANGFSRTICFAFDTTNWVEMHRAPVDISN